jgi:hypothetical protein
MTVATKLTGIDAKDTSTFPALLTTRVSVPLLVKGKFWSAPPSSYTMATMAPLVKLDFTVIVPILGTVIAT